MTGSPRSLKDELARLGPLPDGAIDLAGAALALAALQSPGGELDSYRRHLESLAATLAQEARGAARLEDKVAALVRVMAGEFRYTGDEKDYDNLDNADLRQVIDRRRGLPVTLGILYIHAARAQGWPIQGLNFPAHFLVRMEDETGHRAIIDPFHDGKIHDAASLRELLKTVAGSAAELEPSLYAPVGNRDILVRLQNNIKLRLLRNGEIERALAVVEAMLLFAPDQVMLWREAGMMELRLGNLKAAIALLEQFVARAPNGPPRHRVTILLQDLRGRLN